MKKLTVASLFIATQIVFVFLHIHKHMYFIKTSFNKQKQERTRDQLLHQKELVTQQLQSFKNRTAIKEYALSALRMKPIRLNQIKRLHHHESSV